MLIINRPLSDTDVLVNARYAMQGMLRYARNTMSTRINKIQRRDNPAPHPLIYTGVEVLFKISEKLDLQKCPETNRSIRHTFIITITLAH